MSNVIEQGVVWDYYKPRHTHSWNMLQLAAQHLVKTSDEQGFETEYAWENLIKLSKPPALLGRLA